MKKQGKDHVLGIEPNASDMTHNTDTLTSVSLATLSSSHYSLNSTIASAKYHGSHGEDTHGQAWIDSPNINARAARLHPSAASFDNTFFGQELGRFIAISPTTILSAPSDPNCFEVDLRSDAPVTRPASGSPRSIC